MTYQDAKEPTPYPEWDVAPRNRAPDVEPYEYWPDATESAGVEEVALPVAEALEPGIPKPRGSGTAGFDGTVGYESAGYDPATFGSATFGLARFDAAGVAPAEVGSAEVDATRFEAASGTEASTTDGTDDDAQWEWPSAGAPPRHTRIEQPAPVTEPLSGAEVESVEWIAALGVEDIPHEQWATAYPSSPAFADAETDPEADLEAGAEVDPDAELDAGLNGLLSAGSVVAPKVETDGKWQETQPSARWQGAQPPADPRDAEPAHAPHGVQETEPFDAWHSGPPADTRQDTQPADFWQGAEAAGGRPHSDLAGDKEPVYGVTPAEWEAPRQVWWTEEFTAAEPVRSGQVRGGAEYGWPAYGGPMPAGPLDDLRLGAPPDAPSAPPPPRGASATQMLSREWRDAGTQPGRKRRVPARYRMPLVATVVVVVIASLATILGLALGGGPDNPAGSNTAPTNSSTEPIPAVNLPSESAANESPSALPSASPSLSPTPSRTPSRTPKPTATAHPSPSRTPSRSPSRSPSSSPSPPPPSLSPTLPPSSLAAVQSAG